MKFHHIPIIVLSIALIVIGVTTFVADMGNNYGSTADFSTINKTTSSFDDIINNSENMKQEIDDFVPESGSDLLFIPYRFLRTAWASARYLWSSFTTLGSIVEDLGTSLGSIGVSSSMSNMVIAAITAILTITVVAIIIYAFFKWKFED
jgi:ABC-type maltose transport system permease subunit